MPAVRGRESGASGRGYRGSHQFVVDAVEQLRQGGRDFDRGSETGVEGYRHVSAGLNGTEGASPVGIQRVSIGPSRSLRARSPLARAVPVYVAAGDSFRRTGANFVSDPH